eukprot:CAMPEP_0119566010 /NCGR_PEP_ID=MMETSP1352-20130426/31789_1 /TAXON_ID=265584 /ORGANISM="Stauroneis constricta, Strain CCMP1120" /LENGTH=383 /DNA_ID=CAMNT_0007615047 /DNA_START=45 /DNA_END=1196 /DNA_ORIENTATION=-
MKLFVHCMGMGMNMPMCAKTLLMGVLMPSIMMASSFQIKTARVPVPISRRGHCHGWTLTSSNREASPLSSSAMMMSTTSRDSDATAESAEAASGVLRKSRDMHVADKEDFDELNKDRSIRDAAGSDDSHGNADPPKAAETASVASSSAKEIKLQGFDRHDLPWSQIQQWALRDQLPKYTMILTLKGPDDVEFTDSYALWRSLASDVTELSGYPLDFLQRVHDDLIVRNETILQATPRLLPYMDSYGFSSSGGVFGSVYGVPGVADGTSIETSAVENIQLTLPKGYIRTADGFAAYELGNAVQADSGNGNGMFQEISSNTIVSSLASSSTASLQSAASIATGASGEEDADQLLLRLGATTGILLAGATAVNMLSHHLTVNVFWV